MSLFWPMRDNDTAFVDFICDPVEFADVFSVPLNVQVNDLSTALCNMIKDNALVEELKTSFKIDSLIEKVRLL